MYHHSTIWLRRLLLLLLLLLLHEVDGRCICLIAYDADRDRTSTTSLIDICQLDLVVQLHLDSSKHARIYNSIAQVGLIG